MLGQYDIRNKTECARTIMLDTSNIHGTITIKQ